MGSEEATFDDAVGFRILGYNKALRWLMGNWPNAVGPVPNSVLLRRFTFGLLGCFCVLSLLVASSNGARISLAKQDLDNVAKNLILFSVSISMLHKYSIFINQERGITRMALWTMKVKRRNEKDNVQPTHVEVFLRRNAFFFYYGGNLAPWVMFSLPLLHGKDYCFKLPYIDDSQKYIVAPFALVSYILVACELVYDAACLLNVLVTFRSELHRLGQEWARMDVDQGSFLTQLKHNVVQHVELLEIFKDLKNLKNSMFGYQVFATILTTCPMIYGCSKDAEFLREAASQMLPIFLFAILEFALLCWLGEEISSGFQEIHRAVHMTNWYEADLQSKHALTIILEFDKKPQVMTGFTVFTANLSTFVETMKQSFSLYTLLKTID